jgi:hypothetical protein
MNVPVELDMLFAVPFDHDVFIDADVLGLTLAPEIAGRAATVEFPRDNPGNRALLPPNSTAAEMACYLPDEVWGIQADHSHISITAALMRVPCSAVVDFDLDKHQAGGPFVRDLLQEVADWWDSFCHWLWVITSQPLNPADPDPKVVNRRSRNVVSRVQHGVKSSACASGSPTIPIIVSASGLSAERKANSIVMTRAGSAAGSEAPLALEAFASARMSARRGDRRRSFINIGLACESVLSSLLGLPVGHKLTLGALVASALQNGFSIPADMQTSVVDPRNDAVHRGEVSRSVSIQRALEITDELISMIESQHIRVDSLPPINRPQRLDLLLIKPPHGT